MVSAGLVPMTIVDDYIAEFWHQVFPGLVLNRGAAVRTDAQTAMMVRKGSPKLLAELNAFIARYPEGSLQRNVLLQKYLKSLKYAKPATSGDDAKRFRQVVDLMRKYGDQYGMDYLLVAAQGYQESGLDHNRKSAVGRDRRHAGHAEDRRRDEGRRHQASRAEHPRGREVPAFHDRPVLCDEPMDDLNKALFAFASYNAGPSRIRQLRQRAAERGLDPNQWFNNVEVVASESIGRETVQYVSNIYKYYLAYHMVVEQMERRDKAKQGT
jgi:membrane-bound lytic murein transglycosylase MltF